MKTKRKLRNNVVIFTIIAVLFVAAVVVGVSFFIKNNENNNKTPSVIGGGDPIEEDGPVEKNSTGIDLPGYASITFKAGEKKQDFKIPNPTQNTCLVRMSLILENGTTIWTSELVKPGYYCKPIELIAPIERGEYKNVTLKYECFTDDADQKQLNGAQSSLTIIAK